MEDPPPIATIPSHPAAWYASVASTTAASVGFGGVRSNHVAFAGSHAAAATRSAMPAARTPGSVTTNGRAIASSASTSASSADAAKPNDTVVRYLIVAIPSAITLAMVIP
jgi:hypothetical protein